MFDWVNDLWKWLLSLFTALKDFLTDLPVLALDGFLSAFASIIESIAPPDFMQEYSISSVLSSLPSGVLFFLNQSGLNNALLILASGFSFRMARKFLTLFQW